MRNLTRKHLIAFGLGFAAAGALVAAATVSSSPAHAQFTVFDPSNYSQNLLTAARTLTQINNQIQSLQNEATMLANQAKNLARVDFPELQQITQTLQAIDRLMAQAQGIGFRIEGLDQQYAKLFPQSFDTALTANEQVASARSRLGAAMAAYRQTMGIQAQVVGSVASDAQTLQALVGRSQGAEGALQAQQATNQLLALTAKQQFQIQQMMAAQYRAEALEQSRRDQAETDARAATRKFLGSGSAYSPR